VKIDTERVIGDIDPLIYGNFIEHLGRCIDGGVFEEGNPLSDANGFRKDVRAAVKAETDFGKTTVQSESKSARAGGKRLSYRFPAHSYTMLKATGS
jgi:hypothetical protein